MGAEDKSRQDCSLSDLGLLKDTSLIFHQHIHVTINTAYGIASNLLGVSSDSSFMLSLHLTHIHPVTEFYSVI